MQTFYNRTQLARHLKIAPETLVDRIESGVIKADAKDGNGRDLFSSTVAESYASLRKSCKNKEVSK